MKVFLTGGTGYIGSAILEVFMKNGEQVTVLTRSREKEKNLKQRGAEPHFGDLKNPEAFSQVASEHDVIIHAGSETSPESSLIDNKAVETLLTSAKSAHHPLSFIYTSGVWVLGNTGDSLVDESAPVDHPAEIVKWRVEVEKRVLSENERHLTTAVIRPGIVYGGSGGICSGFFSSALKDGRAAYVGEGKNRWSLVHRDDLAKLYYLIAKSRSSGIFHGVDGTPTRVLDMAESASLTAGKKGEVQSMPLDKAKQNMGLFADALALDQVVSTKRASKIGWNPVHRSFTDSITQLYQEYASVG